MIRISVTVALLLMLAGCPSPALRNGIFDIQPEDCSITCGEVEAEGRFTNFEADGFACVRRGKCDDKDRAAFEAARRAQE